MRRNISSRWYALQESLWFIPATMTAVAIILALVMVRIDQHLLLDRRLGSAWWLFGGGAEGARGVLSAIAGTMITVTGVVFSITIVALQLASSQFSPRLLRNFTGDRGNQLVLGMFISTFTYSLLVLRAVRSETDDFAVFVPSASVTLAIVLVIISIGFLIFFVHHAARTMQASVIIDRTARETVKLIERLYPAENQRSGIDRNAVVPVPPVHQLRTERGGYLQALDMRALLACAEAANVTIQVEVRIGDFLLPGAQIASVWPASGQPAGTPEFQQQVQDAFLLGPERTMEHDAELGFRQLADIAIKALSPGINDPTTAIICINRIGEALVTLGQRERPELVHTGSDGAPRVVLTGHSFESFVRTAVAQIRHYGADDATVAAHLARMLGQIAEAVPASLRGPLVDETRLLMARVDSRAEIEADRQRVRQAGAWVLTEDSSRPA